MGYPNDILKTRAVIKPGSYAIVPKDGLVNNVIPGIQKSKITILASPKIGASFVQYILKIESGGGTTEIFGNQEGVETFIYCIKGAGKYKVLGKEYEAVSGAYIYAPAGDGLEFENTGKEPMEVLLYKQRYISVKGAAPYVYYGNTNEISFREYDEMKNVLVKDLLPVDISFDMNMHILSFLPGGCHPFVETHVQEHGAYILQGQGCYYLGEQWTMIKETDFVWFGPYVPQAAYGVGTVPFTYIYSKDCHRDIDI